MLDNFPIALTFDIDWAPDWSVKECAELCAQYSIPATFFATHASPFLEQLKKEQLFEIGIHPNFLQPSSQGTNEKEIMNYMMRLVPNAISMRTHGLFQSSNLLFMIINEYKQIKYDFSLCLPNNSKLLPFNYFDNNEQFFTRIPYQWEDDLFFTLPAKEKKLDNIIFKQAHYEIFDFHPIHVSLNSNNVENYNRLKKSLTFPLTNATSAH
ncbi:MAG: hypothetical protein IBJ00_07225, partial [Alphaproteobacteria bacterium]|nr:hypothetical protein [Alphaproteobacteria bacterium]